MSDSSRVTLYYSPQSRATGARVLLEELSAPYDLHVLNAKAGEQREPAYLAINPLGKVPAIRHGDALVTELACVTHSAASQTVAQMIREDLVQAELGSDRRERLVALTPRALAMAPDLERCWAATARAAASLDEDLSFELEPVLRAAVVALTAKPFLDRMVDPAKPCEEN